MGYIWDIYGIYVGIYVVIRHNFTCTSSNIIYCIFCSKCCKLYIGETGRHLSDRFAFLAVMIAVKDTKSVKRLIFKIGTIHPHGLNERFSFIWSYPFISFRFCLARAAKSVDFSPFHSIVYVHPHIIMIFHSYDKNCPALAGSLNPAGSRFAGTWRKTSRQNSFHINGTGQMRDIYMHGEVPFNVPSCQTSRPGKRPVLTKSLFLQSSPRVYLFKDIVR